MRKELNEKMNEFDLCVTFFCELDGNDSSTWFIESEQFSIVNYYNDENTNLDILS